MRKPTRIAVLITVAAACAGSGRGRFPDRAPLLREPENPFSPAPPRWETTDRGTALDDQLFFEWESRMALAPRWAAMNVNSLDEVPDSSFFVNRIRGVTADQVRHGGEDGEGLAVDGDLEVVAAKPGGVTGGMQVKDRRGNRFLVKFDPHGRYGLLSGSEAATSRLLWAAGYNVPDNRVVYVDPGRFVACRAKGAPAQEQIDWAVSRAARAPDGRVRALASKFIRGELLGPTSWRGTRRGDPNDRVPHELRRELRGLRLIYVWVNNPDAKTGNSLDAYRDGLVRHYLIDFGTALAAGGEGPASAGWWYGFSWRFGWARQGVGIVERTAATRDDSRRIRRERERDYLVAGLEREVDPYTFDFLWNNAAFMRMDDADAAWAARILAGFDEEMIRAALEAADWPEAVTERMVARMVTRRDAIVAAVGRRASPLGLPGIHGNQVCAEAVGGGGRRVCATVPAGNGYHVVRLATPGAVERAELRAHVLRGDEELRVVGVERD